MGWKIFFIQTCMWRGWEDSYGKMEDLNKGERGGWGGSLIPLLNIQR